LILFLDTSALVKLYIAEPGSERMREAASREGPVAVSVLAFAEIHATFARRRREELLLATELEQLQLGFSDDWKKGAGRSRGAPARAQALRAPSSPGRRCCPSRKRPSLA
jgi:uncharacterized protein with PIN domain